MGKTDSKALQPFLLNYYDFICIINSISLTFNLLTMTESENSTSFPESVTEPATQFGRDLKQEVSSNGLHPLTLQLARWTFRLGTLLFASKFGKAIFENFRTPAEQAILSVSEAIARTTIYTHIVSLFKDTQFAEIAIDIATKIQNIPVGKIFVVSCIIGGGVTLVGAVANEVIQRGNRAFDKWLDSFLDNY